MITCNVFELEAVVEERTLRWVVRSDLPGGTRIIVDVSRRFVNTRGDQCLWSLWNGPSLLTATGSDDRNVATGTFNIDEGDAHGLSQFNELLGPYSSGINEPIGAEIYVVATVGARQPLKSFGKNNCSLAGGIVATVGGINFVEAEVVVAAGMRREYQPIDIEA